MTRSFLFVLLVSASTALAHDTWVETHTNLVRTGDAVHVDLKLGNHGNNHRDFKLAGKVNLSASRWAVLGPEGLNYDLKTDVVDTGYAPKEGYWTAKFVAARAGMYLVAHAYDDVVSYAPLRSVKSAKTFFVVSDSLDRVPRDQVGFDRALGHALELIPLANPVVPMGPGQAIRIRLLFEGQPLAGATVSFIPRGQTLQEGRDDEFERTTDDQGTASFTPKTGNVYLVVAHHQLPRGGPNYEGTKYSAALTVFVPEICPCCE